MLRRHEHVSGHVTGRNHVADGGVGANGFSQMTCFPASSAAIASGA